GVQRPAPRLLRPARHHPRAGPDEHADRDARSGIPEEARAAGVNSRRHRGIQASRHRVGISVATAVAIGACAGCAKDRAEVPTAPTAPTPPTAPAAPTPPAPPTAPAAPTPGASAPAADDPAAMFRGVFLVDMTVADVTRKLDDMGQEWH